MPSYTITNVSATDYVSTSLSLAAGDSTIMTVDFLPPDLNTGIVNEILVVVSGRRGGGSNDPIVVTPGSIAASVNSQIIATQGIRKMPGVRIYNNTGGDIALRASAIADAGWLPGQRDVILEPGESCYFASDITDPIKGICEVATGTIEFEVYS